MEELLYLLAIFFIGALIVVPIILLIKLSSANRKFFDLQQQIKVLDNKLLYVINNTANKQDVQQILKAISTADIKKEEQSTTEKEIATQPVKEETTAPKPLGASIPASEVRPVEQKREPIPSPQQEKEPIAPQPKVEQPAYAALDKPKRVATVTTPMTAVPPKQPTSPKLEQPKAPGKNFVERILGENWLSKVGIVTLVLGVGFFVKYAIDQNWINEIARVGIGIFTGGLIIAIAHRLKEKYHVFSSILVGGGVSILYITITLAFREYEIFNQTVAFVLLSVITVFSVILSLFYNRQELAMFSLIGGFCSPLMVSTGSGNYIVLFSFILILNTGMLFISLKRDWRLVGIVSYVLSLAFFWTWLLLSFNDQFVGATIFASLFFVQFYLLAIIKHFREEKRLSIFQAVLILTNNLSILFALMYIFNLYEYNVKCLPVIAIAVVNAVVMLTLFRNAKVDKSLIYMVIGLVMSFATLAIPVQLDGYVITMFWAVEMVLLLWLWQKSQINIFRLGFLALGVLTIISYLMDVNVHYLYSYSKEPVSIFNSIFITGFVVLAGFAASLFLWRKEDKSGAVTIKKAALFPNVGIRYLLKGIIIMLAFFVPYLELNYQLAVHTDAEYSHMFRYVTLATYATWFVAVLGILFRHNIKKLKYFFFLSAVALYAVAYSYFTIELRFDIFVRGDYSSGHFLMHLLSLPAIAYLIYLLIVNMKSVIQTGFKVICWVLVILSVIILSIELDHIVIWLIDNPETYFDRLYDVHTFGYPILWGVVAMALMIWGLRKKEVILRQIALISFGLIIIKFYAYDVWLMSQTGLIVSLVILGIILLVVSFLQQKIKILVKEDEKTDILEDEKEKL